MTQSSFSSKANKISLKLFPVLLTFLFVFPILKENLSSFIVILICLNTIIYKFSSKDYAFFSFKSLLLTIPFWIIFCNIFFSSDYRISINHIQHALFFLIIPVFFFLIPAQFFDKKHLDRYILILKITCLVIAITYLLSFFYYNSIGDFFIVFQHISSFRTFVYYKFDLFIIHPTYYTVLLVFCSAHSFDLVLKRKKYKEFIFILSFLLISFLLLTRLNIVLLITTLLLMVFLRSNLKLRKKILIVSGMIVLAVTLAFLTPGIKHRFVELFQSFNVKPKDVSYDSTNIRRAIFDCSVAISKDHFLFGVGFENLQAELNACYRDNYDSSFYENHNYMTHNYFFYILLSTGIFGLLAFLFYLINIIRIALKSKNFLFKVFLFNVIIIWFIEDYLYRQYGILYFNLMLLCFIRYSENVPQENNTKAVEELS